MEPWDSLVTYALDLSLGGGAFYVGTSLTLYLVKRWNELEVKPKQPQVNLPLVLKEQTAEAIPLALEQPEKLRQAMPVVESAPVEPLVTPEPLTPKPAKQPSLATDRLETAGATPRFAPPDSTPTAAAAPTSPKPSVEQSELERSEPEPEANKSSESVGKQSSTSPAPETAPEAD